MDLDHTGSRAVREVPLTADGTVVHLKGYGVVQVCRIVTPDGDTEYWATSDLTMTAVTRVDLASQVWTDETYHRGRKQFCGVERAQVRVARAHRNHVGWAIRALLCLEHHRIRTGTSWFDTKMGIIRSALQKYLAKTRPILLGLAQRPATA